MRLKTETDLKPGTFGEVASRVCHASGAKDVYRDTLIDAGDAARLMATYPTPWNDEQGVGHGHPARQIGP